MFAWQRRIHCPSRCYQLRLHRHEVLSFHQHWNATCCSKVRLLLEDELSTHGQICLGASPALHLYARGSQGRLHLWIANPLQGHAIGGSSRKGVGQQSAAAGPHIIANMKHVLSDKQCGSVWGPAEEEWDVLDHRKAVVVQRLDGLGNIQHSQDQSVAGPTHLCQLLWHAKLPISSRLAPAAPHVCSSADTL